MKTTKKLLVLLVIVFLGFSMVACGQPSSIGVPGEVKEQTDDAYAVSHQYEQLVEVVRNFLEEGKVELLRADAIFQKVIMEADPSYYLVDVRSREDFLAASIQGSISIPYELTCMDEIITRLPIDKKIVIIDDDGGLASQIAASWSLMGYDIAILANGMDSWLNRKSEECQLENYPVSTETSTTTGTYQLPVVNWPTVSTLADIIVWQNEVLVKDQDRGQISAAKVKEALDGDKGLFLLDIRQPDYYQKGHLPGAINIPFAELGLTEKLNWLPPGERIVVIDYDGHYGNMAARLLNHLGYEASALAGGMSSWSTNLKVIGKVPNNCAWINCYGVTVDEKEPADAIAQCNWGKLPTVKTELSVAAGAGCS